jgi:hypothetical protein
MTKESFINKVNTIKDLKDKVDEVSNLLTKAFSISEPIYVDSFLLVVDKMTDNLCEDLSEQFDIPFEVVQSYIDEFIYDSDFGTIHLTFELGENELYYTRDNLWRLFLFLSEEAK